MYIKVKLVILDYSNPNYPVAGVVEESINTAHIVKQRTWHRKEVHNRIEGDLIKVYMARDGKEYFHVVNETLDSFIDRLNELSGKACSPTT